MEDEPSIAEASCTGEDGDLHEGCDTVEILFAWGSSTERETHRIVLGTEFDPSQVRVEPAGDELASSGSTADILVLADAATLDHGNRDVDLLQTQNPDCRVLGVVENGSDADLAHSSLDEMLVRPVSNADLVDAVSRLLRQRAYSRLVRQHSSVASELATLEAVNTPAELAAGQKYTVLSEALAVIESELAELPEEFDGAGSDALLRELER